MNIKKPLLVAGAVATVGLAGIAGTGIVSAATEPSPQDGLVGKIATKFNLNKDEVKAVFDADHAEHCAQMEQKFIERLEQAVKEGKLTAEQKEKIAAKHKELQAQMESDRGAFATKTRDEIKTIMDERHAELEQWAKDNNIPGQFLRFHAGMHHSRGPGAITHQ